MHWLNEKFEQLGDWRLPGKSEDVVAGNIQYDGMGTTHLILNGGFQDFFKAGALRADDVLGQYPIIHGSINNGHAVTILNGLTLGTSMASASAGGRFSEQIRSNFLVIGCHITPDTKFKSFSMLMPGFETWLSRANIEREFHQDGAQTFKTIAIPSEEIYLPSIASKLRWFVGRSTEHNSWQSTDIKIHAGLTFEPDVPQPIEWIYQPLGRVSYLMTMLSGSPMFAGQISAIPEGVERPHSCDVLAKFSIKKTCELKNLFNFFMSRKSMGVDFEETIKRWFDKYEPIKYPINLAVGTMCSDEQWDHIEFVLWMQCLEGFHRATTGDEDMKFSPRLDALANVLSQRGREIIFGPQKVVPRAWIDTRNYYTHWFTTIKSNVLDGKPMYIANLRARSFVRALYLNYAGVPMAQIDEALYGRSDEAQNLIYFLNEERGGRV